MKEKNIFHSFAQDSIQNKEKTEIMKEKRAYPALFDMISETWQMMAVQVDFEYS